MQQETAFVDIAYDILGPFLASKKNRPYFVVFNYFEHHGLMEPSVTSDTISEHFHILLRGFIRKELTLIRGVENPQIRNLKRRIKDILNGPDYSSRIFPGESEEGVFAIRNDKDLRDDLPPITPDSLDSIVREAFRTSSNRAEWCAQIFQLLNQDSEVRTAIPKHQLVSIMIAVNAEYTDAVGIVTGHLPTPREEYLSQAARRAMSETLDWVQSTVITRFVTRDRLSAENAPLILNACRAYLEDLTENGDADKIPQYFLTQKPGLTQSDYLKQYKYVMDTVTNRALAELRKRLRENPTIWPFSHYSPVRSPGRA